MNDNYRTIKFNIIFQNGTNKEYFINIKESDNIQIKINFFKNLLKENYLNVKEVIV